MNAITLDQRLSRAATAFLSSPLKMLINGQLVDAAHGKTFSVFDPATGSVIAHAPEGEAEDIDRAVKAARTAFDDGPWGRMPTPERAKLIWKLADLMEVHFDELAELEALDGGKPISAVRAAELPAAIETFRYMAGWSTKLRGSSIPLLNGGGEFHSYTIREPVGVAGQIIPWNFPLQMAAWKLAPALAAGCTLVLKPAEQTPLTALRIGQLALDAGFPAGVLNIVTGFGETAGAALAAHPLIDKIAFTGSTEVGKRIVEAARHGLKRVTLELGGKSPAIVLPDADIDVAIAGTASGIFFNAGQTCCASSRLMAHEEIFDQLVDGIGGVAKSIKLGASLDPTTEMGPLVSQEQYSRVSGYIRTGLDEGAEIAASGSHDSNSGFFVDPTILVNTRPEMRIVREEIFGPVLVVERFGDEDLDRIAKQANDTQYGLAASIWTRNISLAHKMAKRLRAGSVWINCHNLADAAVPFGGFKQSGWGRELGEEGLNAYTEVKAVTAAL